MMKSSSSLRLSGGNATGTSRQRFKRCPMCPRAHRDAWLEPARLGSALPGASWAPAEPQHGPIAPGARRRRPPSAVSRRRQRRQRQRRAGAGPGDGRRSQPITAAGSRIMRRGGAKASRGRADWLAAGAGRTGGAVARWPRVRSEPPGPLPERSRCWTFTSRLAFPQGIDALRHRRVAGISEIFFSSLSPKYLDSKVSRETFFGGLSVPKGGL